MSVAAPKSFDSLLLLIGRLNYVWTNTESLLIHLIAGLARTDKETGMVVFLTLNTTRARVDLVERLAKLDRTPAEEQERILAVTQEVVRLSAVRNHYSHSIYAFDPESGDARTITMRIADRKHTIKVGQTRPVDDTAIAEVESTVARIAEVNARIWQLVHDYGYPV